MSQKTDRADVGFADAACAPIDFPTAPTLAVPAALKAAGVSQDEIALWEFNEAFSVVAVAAEKVLGLDRSIVNVRGGAVALGHVSLRFSIADSSPSDLQAAVSSSPLSTRLSQDRRVLLLSATVEVLLVPWLSRGYRTAAGRIVDYR